MTDLLHATKHCIPQSLSAAAYCVERPRCLFTDFLSAGLLVVQSGAHRADQDSHEFSSPPDRQY